MQSLNRVLHNLQTYWLIVSGAVISLLLLTITNAITPQLFRLAIDRGIAEKNLQVVLYSAGAMLLVAVGRGLFNFGQILFRRKSIPRRSFFCEIKSLIKLKISVSVIAVVIYFLNGTTFISLCIQT